MRRLVPRMEAAHGASTLNLLLWKQAETRRRIAARLHALRRARRAHRRLCDAQHHGCLAADGGSKPRTAGVGQISQSRQCQNLENLSEPLSKRDEENRSAPDNCDLSGTGKAHTHINRLLLPRRALPSV